MKDHILGKQDYSFVDVVTFRCQWAFHLSILSNRQLNISSEAKGELSALHTGICTQTIPFDHLN